MPLIRWLLPLIALVCPLAQADAIYLKNGDRLTGTAAEGPDGTVIVTSSYGPAITFKAADIDRVESDSKAARVEQEIAAAVLSSPPKPPPRSWDANVTLNSMFSRGNTDSQTFNLQAGYKLKRDQQRYTADISSLREKKNGDQTKEEDELDLGYKYLFKPKWFFATNVLLERDPIAELDRRISVNPGVGYIVFEEEDRSLNFQLGAGYADEQVDGMDESSAFVEWRLDYEQDLLGGAMEFFHKHKIYRNVSGRKNAVFNSQTGIRYDIMKGVYLNAQANYDYDTEPAVGAEEEDLTFLIGAGVNF